MHTPKKLNGPDRRRKRGMAKDKRTPRRKTPNPRRTQAIEVTTKAEAYRARVEAKALQGAPPTAKVSKMRTFILDRTDDLTGTSGTGVVAEGVQFSSGQVALHWLSQLEAVNVYGNALVLETLHGHGGGTRVMWQAQQLSDALKGFLTRGAAGQPVMLTGSEMVALSNELRLLLGVQ